MLLWLYNERRRRRRPPGGYEQRRDVISFGHRRGRHFGENHFHPVSRDRAMTDCKDTAVALDHVSKAFGGKQVLRDITFSVAPQETICVLGRSGTGKSVTLK